MPGSLKTEGIVLRSMRYGEADRILHLYTPQKGRLSAIAKVRTIRQPLLVPVPSDGFPPTDPVTKVEWPIPR